MNHEDDVRVPTTTVDLMVQFRAGLRTAGHSEDEITAQIDGSIIAERDARESDLATWAAAAFTSDNVRSLYYARVETIEGNLTFDDATAYFARDAKAMRDGPASGAIGDVMNDIAIIRAMEGQGIEPDLSESHGI
jgi:hypothetical protein